MIKNINLVNFIKKISSIINSSIEKNLNKLKSANLSKILKNNKTVLISIVIFFLFLFYLLIPSFYDKTQIVKKFNQQLKNNFNLNFDISDNTKYGIFPKPHFIYQNFNLKQDNKQISKINKLKIYISVNNFFSFDNLKIKDLVIFNSNFNLDYQTYDFLTNLLDKNFKEKTLTIKNSNVFFRNKENEVLLINKVSNIKYYFDNKDDQNKAIFKNEIFNMPYSLKLNKIKSEKKIFSELNIKSLDLNLKNNFNYDKILNKGKAEISFNKNKSNLEYYFNKNLLTFNLFDDDDGKSFFYKGDVNIKPFFSKLEGRNDKINLFHLFNENGLLLQLLKTEIFHNKNLNVDINIFANKNLIINDISNVSINSKIKEGLIDIDKTKFSWRDDADFEISDSLIYVKDNELFLAGKLAIDINSFDKIYKFLLTPKKSRTQLNKINTDFVYNFSQQTLEFASVKIDGRFIEKVNQSLDTLTFKSNMLQNKILLKNFLNKIIKSYAG